MDLATIDYNLAVAIIGFVVSIAAERLPGLSTYWHGLTAGRKRAFVALACVIFGVGAVLVQGGELEVNRVLSDLVLQVLDVVAECLLHCG